MHDPRIRRDRPSRAPRLYQSEGLAPGAIVTLDASASRHVVALRLARNDSIVLFGGDGVEYAAEIVELSKRGVAAKVGEAQRIDRESPLAITLAQGICAADRMDLVIQKATELGVHAIQPLVTTRTVIRLSSDRQERREQHWQAVAIAACEQSGRNRVPEVRPRAKLDEFVADLPAADARIVLLPGGEQRLADLPRARSVLMAIGPEGGLTAEEHDLLASRGFIAVRFGPRVLRTETAPVAAIAALQVLWGDC